MSATFLTNQFLIAMPGMADETFERSVVYLCEHTDKGALGLVINKPIDIKLKNLFEKVELNLERTELAEQPVYFQAFFIRDRIKALEAGEMVSADDQPKSRKPQKGRYRRKR